MNEEEKKLQPETEQTAPEEQTEPKEDFQSLIRGRYRDAYLRHVAGLLAAQAEELRRDARAREIRRQALAFRAEHPDFDLNRELENPQFAALLRDGVELATAYAAIHRGETERAGAARMAGAAQPRENGLGSGAPAVFRADPRSLSPQERRALRRRAARGEEIVW